MEPRGPGLVKLLLISLVWTSREEHEKTWQSYLVQFLFYNYTLLYTKQTVIKYTSGPSKSLYLLLAEVESLHYQPKLLTIMQPITRFLAKLIKVMAEKEREGN